MKYKSISFIENYLQTIINEEIKTIINKISNDYNKNIDINNYKITYKNNIQLKLHIENFIKNNIRCLGIIKSGAQCARTRKCNNTFCKIHQKTLKFGKVIHPNVDSPE